MKRSLRIALSSAALLPLVQLPAAANAQQAGAANTQQGVEDDTETETEIVVTGSLIRREESSQLVTTLDAEEIQLRGATNASDILATVSQNQPIIQSSATSATSGGLTSLADLRSLGAENTLVLINGKRVVRNPLRDNGVDLNVVPTALLGSVDVLSDGASSIYGSDAVAGVINFRTKDEVQGIQYYAHTLQPEAPGGELYAGALSLGAGSLKRNGWNVFVGGTWRKRNVISTRDRDFSRTSVIPERGVDFLLGQSFPANFSQFNANGGVIIGNANPFPQCSPPITVPFRGGCGLDSDLAGFIDLQNPEEQQSAIGRFSALLGEHKASVEYLRAWSTITSSLTPTTFFDYEVPTTSPFFPGKGIIPAVPGMDPNRPIFIRSRFTPAGRRITENSSDTDRILAQLEGEVGGFDYELWALRSTATAKLKSLEGAVLISRAQDGFAGLNGAPFINPFGKQTAAGAQFLQDIQVRDTLARGEGKLSMAGFTIGRDLLNLPAGPVSTALAFEYADEKVRFIRNPITNQLEGAVTGGDQNAGGSRTRYAVTGEVLVPLLEGLEVNASVRLDDYSDFGRTINPKVLISYDATPYINLHGSYNTGFRAPTLYNLFTPSTLSFIFGVRYNDPLLCPGGVANGAAGGVEVRDCNQLYNTLLGGNPDLDPEESTAFALGFNARSPEGAFSLGKVSFSVDYWNYELRNRIGPLSHPAIFGNPDRFSNLLVRCSDADPVLAAQSGTCTFPSGGDPIAYVIQANTNLGKTKTSGLDFTFGWSHDSGAWNIALDYRGTYVIDYDFERVPGDPMFSRKAQHFDGFPVIDYSHYVALTGRRGPLSVQIQNRYKNGYEDCNAQCGIAPQFYNRVDAYSLWNLAVTYDIAKELTITGHITNLLNTSPPFSNTASTLCTGCDLRFIDPTGRAFGVTIRGSLESLGRLF